MTLKVDFTVTVKGSVIKFSKYMVGRFPEMLLAEASAMKFTNITETVEREWVKSKRSSWNIVVQASIDGFMRRKNPIADDYGSESQFCSLIKSNLRLCLYEALFLYIYQYHIGYIHLTDVIQDNRLAEGLQKFVEFCDNLPEEKRNLPKEDLKEEFHKTVSFVPRDVCSSGIIFVELDTGVKISFEKEINESKPLASIHESFLKEHKAPLAHMLLKTALAKRCGSRVFITACRVWGGKNATQRTIDLDNGDYAAIDLYGKKPTGAMELADTVMSELWSTICVREQRRLDGTECNW